MRGYSTSRSVWKKSPDRRPVPLELAFDTRQLRTLCENESSAQQEYGSKVAAALKRRLADLRAASRADDLIAGRPIIFGEAESQRIDFTLDEGYHMVFWANHPTPPITERGTWTGAK